MTTRIDLAEGPDASVILAGAATIFVATYGASRFRIEFRSVERFPRYLVSPRRFDDLEEARRAASFPAVVNLANAWGKGRVTDGLLLRAVGIA